MKDFFDLFSEELKDLYSAELQLIEAIPMFARASKCEKLQEALENHLEETKVQAQRLERIASELKIDLRKVECEAMTGLIQEGKRVIGMGYEGDVKDAAIISQAQRIEHYEIAGYGSLKAFARHLHLDDAVEFLCETLEEEANADKQLTKIAEGSLFTKGINKRACPD